MLGCHLLFITRYVPGLNRFVGHNTIVALFKLDESTKHLLSRYNEVLWELCAFVTRLWN